MLISIVTIGESAKEEVMPPILYAELADVLITDGKDSSGEKATSLISYMLDLCKIIGLNKRLQAVRITLVGRPDYVAIPPAAKQSQKK